jgi:malonyl-CoA decarboxylase
MVISNIQGDFDPKWIDFIKLDPVHPVDDKKTLLRRLGHDRMIYTLVIDNKPVAMLQVALTNACPTTAKELWKNKEDLDFNYAVFYSVFRLPDAENAKGSVKDLIFGAASDLQKRYPAIAKFITLSPIPSLRKSFKKNPDIESVNEFVSSKKDPVARFHIMNGAVPWAIRPKADFSKLRRQESWGWMASYDYTPLLNNVTSPITSEPILTTL